jgi:hypothetical protein
MKIKKFNLFSNLFFMCNYHNIQKIVINDFVNDFFVNNDNVDVEVQK